MSLNRATGVKLLALTAFVCAVLSVVLPYPLLAVAVICLALMHLL